MLRLQVGDILDFNQIKNKKLRKSLTTFDIKEAIKDVIAINKHKAISQGN